MAADTESRTTATPSAEVVVTQQAPIAGLVRCGAELVELSERFYRGMFVGCVIFVGMAACAALVLLPLRSSDATYTTVTVILTALLMAATPFAVWRADALYRVLRGREVTHLAIVLLAAALVIYPLRSELWWPSCALLMLLATLVSLRRALAYCLVVLVANLAAHVIAGDLGETPPVTIIGLWVGYVFWASAFCIFNDRLAAHVLCLNARPLPDRAPPKRVQVHQEPTPPPPSGTPSSHHDPPNTPARPAHGEIARLTARQLQVIALVADGLRYEEVAACLGISAGQVQRHMANAITRLGVRNANALTAVAVSDGLVPERDQP